MKILIYGAGVLGSFYAARLQEAGHDVSILARGQRLRDLEEHGVVLQDAVTGRQTITRVGVVSQLVPEDAYDLVVVIVRKNQLASVLPALVKNGHTPDVLFMLNNAAGPQEMVDALGRERVVLGFPVAGGVREGHVVRYLLGPKWLQKMQPIPLRELDGSTSPRLERIMGAFREAGFSVAVSPNMDAWLKTHAAVVVSMGAATYAVGGDARRLSRSRNTLILMLRAIRENFAVLRTLGVPVTPRGLLALGWLPESLLVAFLRRILNTKTAKLGLGTSADAAPDELRQLAGELGELARAAAVPTPATDRLRARLDLDSPQILEGSVWVPRNLRAVGVVFATAVGVLAVLRLSRSRCL